MSDASFVSVVVPVYNDPDGLRSCLTALEQQTYPSDAYEMIAVDNNSDDPIEGIVENFPHAVAAFEARQGSYAARNRGLQVAKGELLAFTDADCKPDANWLRIGIARFEDEGDSVGIVGGEIEMTFQNSNAPTPSEILDAMTGFDQKAVCTERNFSATANLFTSRGVVEQVGDFASDLKSAGDKEFGHRVVRNGFEIVYEPDAVVRHPARRTPKALFKKRRRLAKGQYDLRVRQGPYPLSELLRDAVNHLRPMKGMIPRIIKDSRLSSPLDRLKGILIYLVMEMIFPLEKIWLWGREDNE